MNLLAVGLGDQPKLSLARDILQCVSEEHLHLCGVASVEWACNVGLASTRSFEVRAQDFLEMQTMSWRARERGEEVSPIRRVIADSGLSCQDFVVESRSPTVHRPLHHHFDFNIASPQETRLYQREQSASQRDKQELFA